MLIYILITSQQTQHTRTNIKKQNIMTQLVYSNGIEADASNFGLLKQLFGNSKHFTLIAPRKENSVWDGFIATKKNGEDRAIYVEVKRRSFTNAELISKFNSEFFLEQAKFKHLHENIKKNTMKGSKYEVWYMCETLDGYIYIFDITDQKFNFTKKSMNNVTYTAVQQKVDKPVALLSIKDAKFTYKIQK